MASDPLPVRSTVGCCGTEWDHCCWKHPAALALKHLGMECPQQLAATTSLWKISAGFLQPPGLHWGASIPGMTDAWLLCLGRVPFLKEEVWCLCGQVALGGHKELACGRSPALGSNILLPFLHVSSFLTYHIHPSSQGLPGCRRRWEPYIALEGSESFFKSCSLFLRLQKCVVLKAVWEPILNGEDKKRLVPPLLL